MSFSDMAILGGKTESGLVPLFPVLGVIIYKTLAACENFSSTMERIIQFPPPVAPGMGFFMRGYFDELFWATLSDAGNRLGGGAVDPRTRWHLKEGCGRETK